MIKFEKVTKKYNTGDVVLNSVSFEISDKEMVCLTGPSGSGKTSIFKIIYKEIEPSSGSVFVNGLNLNEINSKSLPKYRQQVGYAFQDFKLIPDLNVYENLALSLEILSLDDLTIKDRINHLLKLVGLENKSELFPGQLSGGEIQRVSIARAISTEPKILLADEPTGNLDSDTSRNIADLLIQINKLGTTVLIATHDNEVITHLKARQISINKGEIINDKETKPKIKKLKPKTDEERS